MLAGGVVTLHVSNMDRAVWFYNEVLGLKLAFRAGDHWAQLEASNGLAIGLHPASEKRPAAPSRSISIGFHLSCPIDEAVEKLRGRGVTIEDPVSDGKELRIAHLQDPDGYALYLAEVGPTATSPEAAR